MSDFYSETAMKTFAYAAFATTLLVSSIAHAAGTPADAEAKYKQEVNNCNSGQTKQDKATCLREAGAARDEARRQRLDDGQSPATLRANALARCDAQPADDREACRARARNSGVVSGNPADGGVLREHVERQTVTPGNPTQAPSPK